MRILLVGPTPLDGVGGNITTITRLRAALAEAGHDVDYRVAGDAGPLAGRPDIVHAFHALRSGPAAVAIASDLGAPVVVTLTGTDLRPSDVGASTGPLCAVLDKARAVVVFDESMRDEVASTCGALDVVIIPQGFEALAPGDAGRGREILAVDDDAVVFVMVAGLRPVKQPHIVAPWLRRLRQSDPRVAWRVIGPRLDASYAAALDAALAREGAWARWIPPVPHGVMSSVYAAADVVVNASATEGMSAALMEAMACGRAVLAADIPANRALVRPAVNGLLFSDEASFIAAARSLLEADLRIRLGESERTWCRFSAAEEGGCHLALYARLLGRS